MLGDVYILLEIISQLDPQIFIGKSHSRVWLKLKVKNIVDNRNLWNCVKDVKSMKDYVKTDDDVRKCNELIYSIILHYNHVHFLIFL